MQTKRTVKVSATQKYNITALDDMPSSMGHPESTRILAELVLSLEAVYTAKPTKKNLNKVDQWLKEAGLFLRLTNVIPE